MPDVESRLPPFEKPSWLRTSTKTTFSSSLVSPALAMGAQLDKSLLFVARGQVQVEIHHAAEKLTSINHLILALCTAKHSLPATTRRRSKDSPRHQRVNAAVGLNAPGCQWTCLASNLTRQGHGTLEFAPIYQLPDPSALMSCRIGTSPYILVAAQCLFWMCCVAAAPPAAYFVQGRRCICAETSIQIRLQAALG